LLKFPVIFPVFRETRPPVFGWLGDGVAVVLQHTGGCAIQTIGMPSVRSLLLTGVVVALAATVGAAWLHEARPRPAAQPMAQAVATRVEKPEPPALTADEERFATALWAVHREAIRSAVAMSFAGIAYHTDDRDARALARKIEPLAKFFQDAEMQVSNLSPPPSLSRTHGQYIAAMALYADAAAEILKFTEDGDPQRLDNAHQMDVKASEDMLRVGEVLWPGQYKPH
jgi:hypothetical protein